MISFIRSGVQLLLLLRKKMLTAVSAEIQNIDYIFPLLKNKQEVVPALNILI